MAGGGNGVDTDRVLMSLPAIDLGRTLAGLHLPEKGIHHLIHHQIQKMTSVLMSSRKGIALWRSLMRRIKARKKAVRYPLPNVRKGVTPDIFQRYSGSVLSKRKQRDIAHPFSILFFIVCPDYVLSDQNSARAKQHINRDFLTDSQSKSPVSPSGTGIPTEPCPEPGKKV